MAGLTQLLCTTVQVSAMKKCTGKTILIQSRHAPLVCTAYLQKQHAAALTCVALQLGPMKRPVRTSQEWRPEPLLCKRFNVPDPFKGRSAPAKNATQCKSEMLQLPDTAAAAEAGFLPGPPPLEALQQLPGPPPIASVRCHSALHPLHQLHCGSCWCEANLVIS